MTDIDEIKTVIVLSGNKRLPHLEAEIFSDIELTTLYLENLCKNLEWCTIADDNVIMAYWYARFELQCRWPSAELLIATSPYYAYRYAYHMIGARWPEAEVMIKTDENVWEEYVHFMNY